MKIKHTLVHNKYDFKRKRNESKSMRR